MPSAAQLGGEEPLPFVRFPFYPTAPWYSTNPNVGYFTRYYSCELTTADADVQVGGTTTRPIRFDIPCRVIAINGSAVSLDDPADGRITEQNMNLQYLIQVQHPSGDKLMVNSQLAATVVGTSRNPGELGGMGFTIDPGGTALVFLTPLVPDLRINITFVCLEMRAPRNFTIGG
jgi:hypothetical protein